MSDEDFDGLVAEKLKHGKYDVLHNWANSGLSSMQVAKDNGIPCILERASTHIAHQKNVLDKEYKLAGLSSPIYSETVKRMKAEYKLADIILCPSEYAASTFPLMFQRKIHIVPFGVDTEMFEPTNMRDRRDGFRALFVGANHMRKGGRYLTEAWKDLDVELWISGSNFITGENIKSFGLVEYDRMPFLMNACDVLVLPSLEEGMALVTLEGMATGLPCIVTPECGSRVEDGIHGMVLPSRDPKAIADAIYYYRDNPSEAKRHGRAGRKLAEKYTWQVYGKKLCDIYTELEK